MTNYKKFILGCVLITVATFGAIYWNYQQSVAGKITYINTAIIFIVQFFLMQLLGIMLKINQPKKAEKSGEVVEDKK